MTRYTISQAAERTGFTTSALRYYEDAGLVRPDRTDSGYRHYSPADVDALQFVARAKGLGLTLDEIHELLPLVADATCAPVQGRMRTLIEDKLEDADRRAGELAMFAAQLRDARDALQVHTPAGACDDDCGCVTDGPRPPRPSRREPIPLVAGPVPGSGDSPGITCTLEAGRRPARLADWQAVLAEVTGRVAVTDGVRLAFARGTDVAALAQLALDEQGCCGFLSFDLRIDAAAITLTVTGPPDARPAITALFGGAA